MIRVLGCSHHHTPIEVRERLAFTPGQVGDALAFFRLAWPGVEAVLLSTCNRVELYTATADFTLPSHHPALPPHARPHTDTPHPDTADRRLFFAVCRRIAEPEIVAHLTERADAAAVRHLFSVTASLDSLVVGEPQIPAQVKQAYRTATDEGTAGGTMHAMFQAALRCGKRVARETRLHRYRVSIPSVAVTDFAGRILNTFADKRILILGAGEMGEETLRYLTEAGATDITVSNRSPARAESLARRWNGTVHDWSDRFSAIAAADLVVSVTGSAEPVVRVEDIRTRLSHRAGRPLLILDLAMPRDFDPAIGELGGVFLKAIDDLRESCERNRDQRDRELPAAQRIIDEETELFLADMRGRMAAPMIRRLRDDWHRRKDAELERLFRRLPDLDETARDEVSQTLDRLVNHILHAPMRSLRMEPEHETPTSLIHTLARIFGVGETE